MDLAKHLIAQLGDQLCGLIQQENEAFEIRSSLGHEGKINWKRVVEGVREMCDVCATTVFNHHWICERCGFMVCPECYGARRNIPEEVSGNTCTNRERVGRVVKVLIITELAFVTFNKGK
jgi:lysine-specific demethylase 3